ncbi:Aps3p [Ascoidea rubescens DSM 1968]|uniref:AP complex subunit sigma n=1 Tax=Ascoidea rubescens DSM 1968 TaxID=1344418 RepID=A0A1D2VP56_9ASCO|nr:putative clathrin-associated protein AP-3 complex component [Ascoidea rubescens DSM 1968]ODV63379.1 putative clathrin-associated protein AP-3 complex component [Ascoidea rubescens DSM 1968]
MIHSVLIFNNDGLPRLLKFYTPVDISTQRLLLRQVHQLVSQRPSDQCSFLTPPPLLEGYDDIRVIYRHYATLYFVFIVDEQESELGILDLIQVFVECLDQCFQEVCELDLVFGWQVLETVLDEIVQGGMVIDTNISRIVAAVDELNSQKTKNLSSTSSFPSPSSIFQAMARDTRMGGLSWPGR